MSASDDDPNAPTNEIIGPSDGTAIATRPVEAIRQIDVTCFYLFVYFSSFYYY